MADDIQYLKKEIAALKRRVKILEGQRPVEEEEPEPEPVVTTKKAPARKPTNPAAVLAWIGGVILALGCIFFVSYAFDQGWVSRTMQIVLGVVFGVFVLAIGHVMHRKVPIQGSLLSGGGLAIAYFSVYAGYAAEAYRAATGLTIFSTTVFLLIVLFGGVMVAIRQKSNILFIESLLLAHIATLLAGVTWLTILFLLLIVAAYCLVVYLRQWETVGWYGAGISLIFGILTVARTGLEQGLTLAIGLFAVFSLLSIGRKNELAATLSVVGGYLLGLLAYLMNTADPAFFTILAAVVSGLLHVYWHFTKKSGLGPLLAALGLLTLWIPMQFEGFAITVAWIILAAIVASAGTLKENTWLRIAANVLIALTSAKLLLWDTWKLDGAVQLWTFLLVGIVLLVLSELYRRKKLEEPAYPFVLGLISLLLIILLQANNHQVGIFFAIIATVSAAYALYSKSRMHRIGGIVVYCFAGWHMVVRLSNVTSTQRITAFLLLAAFALIMSYWYAIKEYYETHLLYIGGVAVLGILALLEADRLWITVSWVVLGVLSLIIGVKTERSVPRNVGLIFIGLAVLKLFVVDTLTLSPGLRIVAYLILGILILGTSIVYMKRK